VNRFRGVHRKSFSVGAKSIALAATLALIVLIASLSSNVGDTEAGSVFSRPSNTDQISSTFTDVPFDYWAHDYIEALFQAGYVSGCGTNPLLYCPDRVLTRAESSVFMLRGAYGTIPDPPHPAPTSPTFVDVVSSFWGYGWIESLWEDGYTSGCAADPLMYCPDGANTRAEASVFFLRIKFGVDYEPPPPTGVFSDVDQEAWYIGWVEAAYNEDLLPECNSDPLSFCPDAPIDRAWAAYMMVKAKELTLPERQVTSGWYQEAHDPQHTGYINEDIPTPWEFKWQWNGSCSDGSDCRPGDPNLGWTFEIPPKSHLVAGNGRLYLPAGDHGIWAIRASDGKTDWQNNNVKSDVTAAFDPEINALFVAGRNGSLYKLSSFDGSVLGTFQGDSGLNLAPIIVNGRIFIVSDNGVLYAVDKHSLDQVWSYSSGSQGQTPAAYSARYQTLVYGTEDLFIHAVGSADGSLRWRVKPTVNSPGDYSYDGGDGRTYRTYNYEHGWPVIAEEHGIVFIRLRLPKSAMWTVPDQDVANWFPSTNASIRSFLEDTPEIMTLFALDLRTGEKAFTPPVGPSGIETPDIDSTLGPLPVVKHLENGDEVVYTLWRNGQRCEAGDCINSRKDTVMCEMVLDGSTVTGYQAGDCRFVSFGPEWYLITDEVGKLTMAGDLLMHAHWVGLYPFNITDRSDNLGGSYSDMIRSEEEHILVNRASDEHDWVNCPMNSSHFCNGWVDTYGERKVFEKAFWVFYNASDPPYESCIGFDCVKAYSDGYKSRYAIVNDGTIYYELNGGTIFAVGSE